MRCKRCCRPRPTRRSLSWRFWQSNSSICFSIWSWHFFIASHSILIVDNCWAWSTHGHTDTEKKQLVQGQALWDCCSRYKWRQKKNFDAFKKKKKRCITHESACIYWDRKPGVNYMFWMPKDSVSSVSCRELTEFTVACTESGGEHRVYSTSGSSFPSFRKHCNHLETASQKLEGALQHEYSVHERCTANTQSVTGFSSHTQQAKRRWWIHCTAMMGRALHDECRRNFATLTLWISDRSARLPLPSHLKLSLMPSGGNYTLIPRCHLELVL